MPLEIAKDLLLHLEFFDRRLDHEIDVVQRHVGVQRRDAIEPRGGLRRREHAPLHRLRVNLLDRVQSARERLRDSRPSVAPEFRAR